MPDFVLKFLHCFLAHHHRIGFERKSEEIEMLVERSDFSFLFAESQSEFHQDGSHQCERLLCVWERASEDDKVIGLSHEIEASVFERPIEAIEHDVRQQWRDDPTLRRTACGIDELAVFHDSRAEKFADDFQNISVGDFFTNGFHDDVVG